MKTFLIILLGLSLPGVVLANLPRTNPSIALIWWSFLFTAAFLTLWIFITLVILIIQKAKKEKIVLPRLMKMGLLIPVIVFIVGTIIGQYLDRKEIKKDKECVAACLACAPESSRARMIQWGGKQVTPLCEVMENNCENWHTCAMFHCGFEPIRPMTEYCPRQG
jgi:hypothetical protein